MLQLLSRRTDARRRSRAARNHWLQGGTKIVIVPEKAEKGFRKGLRGLGYIFPASRRKCVTKNESSRSWARRRTPG